MRIIHSKKRIKMNELDELYERKSVLEERINEFFQGDDYPHDGDRGYQDLLQQLDEVNDDINNYD